MIAWFHSHQHVHELLFSTTLKMLSIFVPMRSSYMCLMVKRDDFYSTGSIQHNDDEKGIEVLFQWNVNVIQWGNSPPCIQPKRLERFWIYVWNIIIRESQPRNFQNVSYLLIFDLTVSSSVCVCVCVCWGVVGSQEPTVKLSDSICPWKRLLRSTLTSLSLSLSFSWWRLFIIIIRKDNIILYTIVRPSLFLIF